MLQLLPAPIAIDCTIAPAVARSPAGPETFAPALQRPSEANTTILVPFVVAFTCVSASERPAAQFVPLPGPPLLIAVLTAALVGFVSPSASEEALSNLTTATSSVDPSATAAALSPTKNVFSQSRIVPHAPPGLPVLPEKSIT